MKKNIYGVTIIKDTQLSGVMVKEGDELFVPQDISEDQAGSLLRMNNRAEEIEAPEKKDSGESSDDEKLAAEKAAAEKGKPGSVKK